MGLAVAVLGRIAVSTETSARLLSETHGRKRAGGDDAGGPLAKKAKSVKKTGGLGSGPVLNPYGSDDDEDDDDDNSVESRAPSDTS
jgi:hypothetical protein